MERLILEKKADFIIGGLHRSEAGLAAMDMSNRYKKVLVLASGNESPGIPAKIASDQEKYRYVWLTTTTSDKLVPLYVPLFDTFKDKWNFKKFYVIVQDTAWARGWGNVFEKILTQKEWEKLGNQAFPLGSSDFSSAFLDAKKNAADVIIGAFDAMESAILMKQWATLKVPALPVAHISPAQCLKFWDATEGRCEYAILDGLGTTSPRISPWAERYMKWCEKEDAADGDPIHNYCGAYCLKEAIEIAGSLDPDTVSKAFLKVDIKDSPMGRLKLDPERHQWILSDDPTKGAVVGWFQWQAGKRVYVFPEKIATGELKFPPWRK
jgi:branched-chain amino acid transport system substrate-binding protein